MGSRGANEPVRVYATGACNVDKAILALKDSNPSEAIDTANILIEFESGSTATIQVCPFVSWLLRLGSAFPFIVSFTFFLNNCFFRKPGCVLGSKLCIVCQSKISVIS